MGHLLLLSVLLSQLVSSAGAVDFMAALNQDYKQGELIVRYKDDTKGAKSLQTYRASRLHSFPFVNAHHIKLSDDTSVAEALPQFQADPNVLYAEPNYRVHKLTVPNDGLYPGQWNLPVISAPTAWDSFTGSNTSNSVIVAVLDTGVAYTHPDLASNLWTNPGEVPNNGIDDDDNGIVDDYYGANFGGSVPGNPWDDDTSDSHGTHTSGIIGAIGNNGTGVSGINWVARIMAVKFLHGPEGSGDLSDALKGVEYALSKGAKIINMSFEMSSDSQALRDTLSAADRAGVLVVSAAGNSSKNLDTSSTYPASIRTANNISVAASTITDSLAAYSNYGRTTVDLAAPGGLTTGTPGAIRSTVWLNNGITLYRTTAGTSMAAPHVTGAAALIWNRYPALTHYQVKDHILKSVDVLPAFSTTTITGGRLNIAKALEFFALSASPASGTVPVTVSFATTSVTAYTSWEWDFGDGTTLTGTTADSRHTYITAGTYTVRVSTSNNLGQTEQDSLIVTIAAPVIASTPESASSDSGDGGGCFIATAAWGSYLHPDVSVLRAFRDNVLLTNGPGRQLVRTYYAVSPPLADYIARHEALRSITRWILTPLVLAVRYPASALFFLFAWCLWLGGTLTVALQRKRCPGNFKCIKFL